MFTSKAKHNRSGLMKCGRQLRGVFFDRTITQTYYLLTHFVMLCMEISRILGQAACEGGPGRVPRPSPQLSLSRHHDSVHATQTYKYFKLDHRRRENVAIIYPFLKNHGITDLRAMLV